MQHSKLTVIEYSASDDIVATSGCQAQTEMSQTLPRKRRETFQLVLRTVHALQIPSFNRDEWEGLPNVFTLHYLDKAQDRPRSPGDATYPTKK